MTHSPELIDRNVHRGVIVDYDVILFEVHTSEFLDIAVKFNGKP